MLMVKEMSVIERHKYLIHPQNQVSFIKNRIKGDRRSLLSGSGSCVSDSNDDLTPKGKSLIDNVSI